jgi:hypothetical protein
LLSDGYESANEQILMDTPLDYYALISLEVFIGLVFGFLSIHFAMVRVIMLL